MKKEDALHRWKSKPANLPLKDHVSVIPYRSEGSKYGAGFWDRPELWEDGADKRLTDASHAYGEISLYAGDDGKLYLS